MEFETARLIQLQALDAEVNPEGPADPDRRVKIIQAMPPEIVSRYERLKKRFLRPVVRLVNGVCEGCRVRIPASTAYKLRASGMLQTCDHCGRFLYFDGD